MKYSNRRRIATISRTARQAQGKVRRWLLDKFKRSFVRRSLEERIGECKMCGKCCKLVFRCPFLKKEGKCQTCSIYELRPAQCRHFPIDNRDLKDLGGTCGYSFKKKKDKK